jgi:hypothetical protein
VSDLRTPWRTEKQAIVDARGSHVAQTLSDDVAAEIVRLVNQDADRLRRESAPGSRWAKPTPETVVEALAQGRDDRRRVMGVKVPDHRAELERRAEPPPTSANYRERFGVQDIATGATHWYATVDDAWFAMGHGSRVVTR